ncbi:predicted protein [Naegleria gruberi]|uniref:Predicted protein n=1 Tax=Naegleria gruberi TaxID=5762 RepID=D2VEX1_NAEGR|nr:uncharacterized protein NAEGRDRAFT_67423 [Naegleria gruberi]EFC44581.1 predicted protein [Naegleria gruberi]|eukprot:XP_002677325.1 predicted protein [Naegleria gruberi strain NEG-M]
MNFQSVAFPDDICFEVFKYSEQKHMLANFLVCQQWFRIGMTRYSFSIKLNQTSQQLNKWWKRLVSDKIDHKWGFTGSSIKKLKFSHLTIKSTDFMKIYSNMKNLKSLSMKKCRIEKKDFVYLMKIKQLESLNIIPHFSNITNEEICKICTNLTNLKDFGISGMSLQYKTLQYITNMKSLTSLDISNTELYEEYLQEIGKMTHLTSLNIGDNGTIPLQYIKSLAGLKSLNINGRFINNGFYELRELKDLHSLTELSVSHNTIKTKGLKYLIDTFPDLTSLDISYNGLGSIKKIRKLKHLTKLDISNNSISDQDLIYITCLPQLTKLNISSNQITDNGALLFASMESLRNIDVRFNDITNDKVFQGMINLEKLKFKSFSLEPSSRKNKDGQACLSILFTLFISLITMYFMYFKR